MQILSIKNILAGLGIIGLVTAGGMLVQSYGGNLQASVFGDAESYAEEKDGNTLINGRLDAHYLVTQDGADLGDGDDVVQIGGKLAGKDEMPLIIHDDLTIIGDMEFVDGEIDGVLRLGEGDARLEIGRFDARYNVDNQRVELRVPEGNVLGSYVGLNSLEVSDDDVEIANNRWGDTAEVQCVGGQCDCPNGMFVSGVNFVLGTATCHAL